MIIKPTKISMVPLEIFVWMERAWRRTSSLVPAQCTAQALSRRKRWLLPWRAQLDLVLLDDAAHLRQVSLREDQTHVALDERQQSAHSEAVAYTMHFRKPHPNNVTTEWNGRLKRHFCFNSHEQYNFIVFSGCWQERHFKRGIESMALQSVTSTSPSYNQVMNLTGSHVVWVNDTNVQTFIVCHTEES